MGSVGKRSLPKCRLRIFRGPCGGRGSGFLSRNISLAVILALVFAPLRDAGVAVLLRQRFSGVSLSGSVAGKVVGRGDFRSWFSLIQLLFSPLYADSGDVLSAGATEPMQDTLDSGKVSGDTVASPVAGQEIEKDSASLQSDTLSSSKELNAETMDTSNALIHSPQVKDGVVIVPASASLEEGLQMLLNSNVKQGLVNAYTQINNNWQAEVRRQLREAYSQAQYKTNGVTQIFKQFSSRGGKLGKKALEYLKKLQRQGRVSDFDLMQILLSTYDVLFLPLPQSIYLPLGEDGRYYIEFNIFPVPKENKIHLYPSAICFKGRNGNMDRVVLLASPNDKESLTNPLTNKLNALGISSNMPLGTAQVDPKVFLVALLESLKGKLKPGETFTEEQYGRWRRELYLSGFTLIHDFALLVVISNHLSEVLENVESVDPIEVIRRYLNNKYQQVEEVTLSTIDKWLRNNGLSTDMETKVFCYTGDFVEAKTGEKVPGMLWVSYRRDSPNKMVIYVKLENPEKGFIFDIELPRKTQKVEDIWFVKVYVGETSEYVNFLVIKTSKGHYVLVSFTLLGGNKDKSLYYNKVFVNISETTQGGASN